MPGLLAVDFDISVKDSIQIAPRYSISIRFEGPLNLQQYGRKVNLFRGDLRKFVGIIWSLLSC